MHLSDEEYMTVQNQLCLIAQIVQTMPLAAFIARANRAETIGPFTDPTLYREAEQGLREIKRLAEALEPFKHAARQIIEARTPERVRAVGDAAKGGA